MPLIKKVLAQEDTEDGWVNLGKQLRNLAPDFARAFSGSESPALLSAKQTSSKSGKPRAVPSAFPISGFLLVRR